MSVIEAQDESIAESKGRGEFRARISDENFNQHEVRFPDQKVTGAQLAEAAGAHPVSEFVVLQKLQTSELETLRPTELANLSSPTLFFVIKGDATYRFTVDGLSLEWPRKIVTGMTIKQLVGKNAGDVELILEREDEPDKVIGNDDQVDLGDRGVEEFRTRPVKTATSIVVNGREKEWPKKKISFSELVAVAYPVPPNGQNIVYTITYHSGPPENPEGTLKEGKSVTLTDGMVFNVRFTDKS
jgi:multiubiquitin